VIFYTFESVEQLQARKR